MQGRLRDDIGELIKEKKKTNTEKDTKPKIQQKKNGGEKQAVPVLLL